MASTQAQSQSQSQQWYILYTLSRHEKKIESYLRKKGIESYLPVYTSTRQWSDRKRTLILPLFPNYLFVKTNPKDFWQILSLNGSIKFIGNGKKPVPVSSSLICDIQKITSGKVEVKDSLTIKGTEVKLTEGPFKGMEGKFVKYRNKNMLVIEIHLLQRVLMLEIEPWHVLIIKN